MPVDTSRNDRYFRGSGLTIKNPAVWRNTFTVLFGGKTIPVGSELRQFETDNFGWTVWTDSEGNRGTAKE